MIRQTTVLALLLAGGLSLVLFSVKYRVQDLEREFDGINRAIAADRQAIHVLEAEWSHLNNPGRLRSLASRYLGLGPIEPEQLGTIDRLPMRPGGEGSPSAVPAGVEGGG